MQPCIASRAVGAALSKRQRGALLKQKGDPTVRKGSGAQVTLEVPCLKKMKKGSQECLRPLSGSINGLDVFFFHCFEMI